MHDQHYMGHCSEELISFPMEDEHAIALPTIRIEKQLETTPAPDLPQRIVTDPQVSPNAGLSTRVFGAKIRTIHPVYHVGTGPRYL